MEHLWSIVGAMEEHLRIIGGEQAENRWIIDVVSGDHRRRRIGGAPSLNYPPPKERCSQIVALIFVVGKWDTLDDGVGRGVAQRWACLDSDAVGVCDTIKQGFFEYQCFSSN